MIVHIEEKDNKLLPYNLEKITFFRNKKGFKISNYNNFFKVMNLNYKNIKVYEKKYKRIRTRKKNPRPIMYSKNLIMNEIKYFSWLLIVKITGYLKIRKLIKSILGWN